MRIMWTVYALQESKIHHSTMEDQRNENKERSIKKKKKNETTMRKMKQNDLSFFYFLFARTLIKWRLWIVSRHFSKTHWLQKKCRRILQSGYNGPDIFFIYLLFFGFFFTILHFSVLLSFLLSDIPFSFCFEHFFYFVRFYCTLLLLYFGWCCLIIFVLAIKYKL